jgi:hypothetical protein
LTGYKQVIDISVISKSLLYPPILPVFLRLTSVRIPIEVRRAKFLKRQVFLRLAILMGRGANKKLTIA